MNLEGAINKGKQVLEGAGYPSSITELKEAKKENTGWMLSYKVLFHGEIVQIKLSSEGELESFNTAKQSG